MRSYCNDRTYQTMQTISKFLQSFTEGCQLRANYDFIDTVPSLALKCNERSFSKVNMVVLVKWTLADLCNLFSNISEMCLYVQGLP